MSLWLRESLTSDKPEADVDIKAVESLQNKGLQKRASIESSATSDSKRLVIPGIQASPVQQHGVSTARCSSMDTLDPPGPSRRGSMDSAVSANRKSLADRGNRSNGSKNVEKNKSFREVQQQAILDQMALVEEKEKEKKEKLKRKTTKNIFQKKGHMWSKIMKKGRSASIIMNQQWIKSQQASYFLGLAVLLNGILMGLQADHASQGKVDAGWFLAEGTFLLIFAAELIQRTRAAAEGCEDRLHALQEFCSEPWNIFDSILVFLHCVQVCIVMPIGDAKTISAFQLIRLACLLRIFRLFRELVLLGYGILGAMRALVWAVWLLIVFLYICSVGATRLLGQNVESSIREENQNDVREWFGSMDRSFFTLMQLVTLENWPDIVRKIMLDHELAWLFFIPFLIFSHYTLLNLVTAVIVENVLVISQKEQNQAVKRDEAERLESMSKLKALFEDMDDDGNGELSLDEFHTAMKDENVIKQFNQLEIAQYEAVDLFDLLDTDHNGSISVSEFIEGALRVRGTAKAKHLLAVQYDLQKCWNDLEDELSFIGSSMRTWVERLHNKLDASPKGNDREGRPVPSIVLEDHTSNKPRTSSGSKDSAGSQPKVMRNITSTTLPDTLKKDDRGSEEDLEMEIGKVQSESWKFTKTQSQRLRHGEGGGSRRRWVTTGRRGSIDKNTDMSAFAARDSEEQPVGIERVNSKISNVSATMEPGAMIVSRPNSRMSVDEQTSGQRSKEFRKMSRAGAVKYDKAVEETKTILLDGVDRLGASISEIAKSQEEMSSTLGDAFEVLCRQLADLSDAVRAPSSAA